MPDVSKRCYVSVAVLVNKFWVCGPHIKPKFTDFITGLILLRREMPYDTAREREIYIVSTQT